MTRINRLFDWIPPPRGWDGASTYMPKGVSEAASKREAAPAVSEPVINARVGKVLDRAYLELWHPRKLKDLVAKSGISGETIRRIRKGDIREGRSVPPFCDAVGIDASAAMQGQFKRTKEVPAVPAHRVHAMLEAIKDTPMGRAIVAQIEAAHHALAPTNDG